MLKPAYIKAVDIPDAWFQCLYNLFSLGRKYINQRGSYEGETRLEFDWITVYITHPYHENWNKMLPEIPVHYGIPNPVTLEYLESYIPYIMTNKIRENESYTYGSRLIGDGFSENQIEYWINVLSETPNTNQAVLQIAQPSDKDLEDPPCLRAIDMRVYDNMLIFYPQLRSWDLWCGFPCNLAAIAILQNYMAESIGIKTGPIIASSKGLHIYGYAEELAKIRCVIGD